MSDTGRDSNLIPDDVQQNYARVRAERGWSWDDMAEQFDRDRQPGLAAWSRAMAAGVDDTGPRYVEDATAAPAARRRRGDAAAPAGRRREPRRRVVPPGPEATAAPAGAALETAAAVPGPGVAADVATEV